MSFPRVARHNEVTNKNDMNESMCGKLAELKTLPTSACNLLFTREMWSNGTHKTYQNRRAEDNKNENVAI